MENQKYISAEQQRLNANAQKEVPLEKWGPYLSERQWGTVREKITVLVAMHGIISPMSNPGAGCTGGAKMVLQV